MELYLVSYDISGDDRRNDYEAFYEALNSIGDAVKIVESTWTLVANGETDGQIASFLDQYLRPEDELIVVRVASTDGIPEATVFSSDTSMQEEYHRSINQWFD